MDDTICAVSTALGGGGISIIRVSGENSVAIVNSIFVGKNLNEVKSHTINYGHIESSGKIIDEVLVSVMRAPRTYTTEDVVEINVHGGIATTNKVLELLLNVGCRLAEPGEFTKRAFLNGRIDLVEAESVADLINADNESARSLSINQLTGKLSSMIKKLKEKIISLEANIHVNIDYPEYEDIEDMTLSKVSSELEEIKKVVTEMLNESRTGKIIKEGIDIAIVGRPNVGKSSILNALLEEEKAIVTDIAGTTRDVVEGQMIISGVKCNFIDTAGIRATEDVVEKIGVDKAEEMMTKADVVIMVFSNCDLMSEQERTMLEKLQDKPHIVFVNKNDMEKKIDLKDEKAVYGNTIEEDGLDDLKSAIKKIFDLDGLSNKDFTYIANARQEALMKKCQGAISRAIEAVKMNVPVDIITIDLEEARVSLGEILGEVYDEELIDELFARFCLGK